MSMAVASSVSLPMSTRCIRGTGQINSTLPSSQSTIDWHRSIATRMPLTTAFRHMPGLSTISTRSMVISSDILDIQPDHILLVGDSAGGNIVAALTGLIVKLNMKKPSGLVLVYPALNLSFTSFTPSVLSSLDDMLLPHTILKMCLECYVPEDYKAEMDPILSPVKFNEEILSNFPPTRIFVGNSDAFHDDCCRLAEKLMYSC